MPFAACGRQHLPVFDFDVAVFKLLICHSCHCHFNFQRCAPNLNAPLFVLFPLSLSTASLGQKQRNHNAEFNNQGNGKMLSTLSTGLSPLPILLPPFTPSTLPYISFVPPLRYHLHGIDELHVTNQMVQHRQLTTYSLCFTATASSASSSGLNHKVFFPRNSLESF